MATPVVLAVKSYEGLGSNLGPTREDLADIIYDISPMDTYFMTNAGRGTCKSTITEWLTDQLTVAGGNKFAEGEPFSAQAVTVPQRL